MVIIGMTIDVDLMIITDDLIYINTVVELFLTHGYSITIVNRQTDVLFT
jgi:hypothetical protein